MVTSFGPPLAEAGICRENLVRILDPHVRPVTGHQTMMMILWDGDVLAIPESDSEKTRYVSASRIGMKYEYISYFLKENHHQGDRAPTTTFILNGYIFIWTADIQNCIKRQDVVDRGCEMRITPLSWWRHQMEPLSALLALCVGNSPVTCEFPSQKASDTELWCFLWSASERTAAQTIETPVIWDAIALIMTSL